MNECGGGLQFSCSLARTIVVVVVALRFRLHMNATEAMKHSFKLCKRERKGREMSKSSSSGEVQENIHKNYTICFVWSSHVSSAWRDRQLTVASHEHSHFDSELLLCFFSCILVGVVVAGMFMEQQQHQQQPCEERRSQKNRKTNFDSWRAHVASRNEFFSLSIPHNCATPSPPSCKSGHVEEEPSNRSFGH